MNINFSKMVRINLIGVAIANFLKSVTPQHPPINFFNIIVFAIAYSYININFTGLTQAGYIYRVKSRRSHTNDNSNRPQKS